MKPLVETDDAHDAELLSLLGYEATAYNDLAELIPNPVTPEEFVAEYLETHLENLMRTKRAEIIKRQAEASLNTTIGNLANLKLKVDKQK